MSANLLNLIEYEDVLPSECNYLELDNDLPPQSNSNNAFVVAHLNIHGLPSKYDDLKDIIDKLDSKKLAPDIILLCETFLTEKNHTRYNLDGYDLISEFRRKKLKGGVSILIRSHIQYVERVDLRVFEEGMFESVFIEISQKGKNSVVIGEVYRIPGTNEKEFIEKYESILLKIRQEHKKIIIGTDQNLDLLKLNYHNNTMKFFESNLGNNVIPTIYKPTRVTHNSATLIDNIYIDAQLSADVRSFIVKSDISDHYMCLTLIFDNLLQITNNNQSFTIRDINDSVLRNMKASLRNRNWNDLNNMTVHESSERLIKEIQTVMDLYAPERIKYSSKLKKVGHEPWFSEGLRISSRKCYQMYQNVISKSRNSIEFLNYKQYRNTFNKLRRKAKFLYYHDLIQENRYNSKKLWNILHKLTGKIVNKKNISDEILVNGVRENNKYIISNAFAKHYSTVGKILADRIEAKGNIKDPMQNLFNRIQHNCFLFPTTQQEIEKLVKNLKIKNSHGYDNISNRMLKKIYPSIIEALVIIFNKSMQTGEFPNNMKLAIVKPLYKGKSKFEIVNYRPVCLLSVISKILEKIINFRVTKFLKKHNILYEGQYGFRQGRSTTDAILDFTGNILDNLNLGHYTISLFLDMSKAFDSIKHETLFKKLEFYGIRGNVLKWFQSYLSGRYIKVNYNHKLSEEYEITYGTPQGSVLGPLMYIILANDLVKSLKFCSCITFADDTTLYASGNNLKYLYKKVNADLEKLGDWFASNSLTLNADKTKFIIFKPKRKQIGYNGIIKLAGKKIERVKHIKFLGVMIDESLEWNLQVKTVLTRMISGNYSLAMVKNILPPSTKLMIYFSNVHCHLNYALSVWGPLLKVRELNKIRKQQNKSIRLIYKVSNRTRLSDFYKKGNILLIDDLIKLSLLKISFRFIYGTLPLRITNLFDIAHHEYYTRNRNNMRAPHHTIDLYNKSYLAQAPHLWLHIQDTLKEIVNIKAFAKGVTKLKIDQY